MKCTKGPLVRYILALLLLVGGGETLVHAAAPTWEHVSAQGTDSSDIDNVSTGRIDICARGGFIYVTVSQKTAVKVFTILGQTVAQQTLQPGTSRLKVPARGIYIVRADNITRRITV